jgi:ribosome-associated translation inhibitor RaiA
MKFVISNQAGIPNKYIRFVKWKMRQLLNKFNTGIYTEVYISSEGNNPVIYQATVIIGVSGPDIVLKEKANNLNELWSNMSLKVKRQLRRFSDRNS